MAVLMFTDLVGSTELKARLGTPTFLALLERHEMIFRESLSVAPSAEVLKDTGDG